MYGFIMKKLRSKNGFMYKSQLRAIEKGRQMALVGKKVIVPLEDCNVECLLYPSSVKGKAPVYFDIHGGGFAFGTVYGQDDVCSYINKKTGMLVVSCAYRLAPTYPYPTPLNDVYSVIKYFINNDDFNIDKSKVFIGGYSAGGNLAAEVCIRAKEESGFDIYKQILMYPYLDVDNAGENRPKIRRALPNAALKLFKECYCLKEHDSKDPYISPVYASDSMVRNLPDTYIVTCGEDNLKIDGEKYAQLLKNNQVKVIEKHYDNAMHGFIENASGKNFFREDNITTDNIQMALAKDAVDDIIKWITC